MDRKSIETQKGYEDDWSDKVEPYTAALGLAGDVIGLGTAATGIGFVPGSIIAGLANIPNIVIDGYQFGRDIYRGINDGWDENRKSALWNGAELALDYIPVKALKYLNKAKTATVASAKMYTATEKKSQSIYKRIGTGAGRAQARKAFKAKARYNQARDQAFTQAVDYLSKRGIRPIQGDYFNKKLIEEMATRGFGVSANDAIQSAKNTIRQNQIISNAISSTNNARHTLKLKQ